MTRSPDHPEPRTKPASAHDARRDGRAARRAAVHHGDHAVTYDLDQISADEILKLVHDALTQGEAWTEPRR